MKYRTEYVRQEWVKALRSQLKTHKRFKRLIDQWIDSNQNSPWGVQKRRRSNSENPVLSSL